MSGKFINSMKNIHQQIRCKSQCDCCGSFIKDSLSCDLDIMESSSFYITLPSNVLQRHLSKKYCIIVSDSIAENNVSKNKHEIALAEIQYPHTWEAATNEEDYQFQVQIGEEIMIL